MPSRSRKVFRRRLDSLDDVPKGEIVRWNLGAPIIGITSVNDDTEGASTVTCWPSWAALFTAYTPVRSAYLIRFSARHPNREPGIERLFAAYQRGGDDGADDESALVAQEYRDGVRRLYQRVGWH